MPLIEVVDLRQPDLTGGFRSPESLGYDLSLTQALGRDQCLPNRYIRLTQSHPQVDIFGTYFLLHPGSVGTHQSTG